MNQLPKEETRDISNPFDNTYEHLFTFYHMSIHQDILVRAENGLNSKCIVLYMNPIDLDL